ncbi:hypothetical protein [Sphingomonas sp. UYP23]
MIRILTAALALCAHATAHAQGLYIPPNVVATNAAIAAAQAKADAATAAIPPVCSSAPAADTVGGTAGVGPPCTPKADAARSTQVMPSQATTAADGTFSGSWPGTFPAAPTTAFASAKTTADPYTCQVGTFTTTTYSGKCWKQTQTLTLPATATALLALQLTTAAVAPAGITVMVVGRQ